LQVKYERISPEYQTLGAYYFNNDMQNITLMPSVKLWGGKFNISANVGFQRNNLDGTRSSTARRNVGAINVNLVPNERWNISGSYSNFSSYTRVRPQSDPFFQDALDSLNFYQVSQTMNGTVVRSFGSKENAHSIMLNSSYQRADNGGTNQPGALSDFISTNMSYTYSHTATGTSVTVASNLYQNNASGVQSTSWGPSLNIGQSFFEKVLRLSAVSTYNQTSSKSNADNGATLGSSPVWNNQLSANYSPKQAEESKTRHSVSFNIAVLRRLKPVGTQPAFTEMTGTLNYSVSF
jgi:hypothetical protein